MKQKLIGNLLDVISVSCMALSGILFVKATYHKGKADAYKDIQDELIKLDNKMKSEQGEA